jgi:hypothetical protein
MSTSSPAGPAPLAAPTRTRIPWVLGLLNVIFGALLLVQAGCGAAALGLLPYGAKALDRLYSFLEEEMQRDWQKRIDAQMEEFDRQAEEAESQEEQDDIEARRNDVLSQKPPRMPRMSTFMEAAVPRGAVYAGLVGAAAGFVLNALMIVSGLRLMKYLNSGRRLALGVAVCKIAMQLTLGTYNVLVIQPQSAAAGQKAMEELFSQMGEGAPPFNPGMFAPSPVLSGAIAVVTILLACAYPVVLLWLLNRRDVREACQQAPGQAVSNGGTAAAAQAIPGGAR